MKGASILLLGLILAVTLATNPLVIIGDKYPVSNLVRSMCSMHQDWPPTWPKTRS